MLPKRQLLQNVTTWKYKNVFEVKYWIITQQITYMLLLFLKYCTNSLYCITKCLNDDDEIYQTRKVVQAENFHKKKIVYAFIYIQERH
jgi:hypothetical protein